MCSTDPDLGADLVLSSANSKHRRRGGVHCHAPPPAKEVYPCVAPHRPWDILSTGMLPRFFVLCSLVLLHAISQTFSPSVQRKEEGDSFLKRAIKSGGVIQQLFCLHHRERKIRLLRDCPCTGLAANPSCLPSLSDSLTCSLPSSIHLVLRWFPMAGGLLCFHSVHLRPAERTDRETRGEVLVTPWPQTKALALRLT